MESEGVAPLNNATFDPKMINHSIDIYFFTPSAPCRAALMLMKALGMKHNIKVVDITQGEHLKPEFIKLNPMHTIPTIVDKEFVLWDSHAIMKYLVSQYAKDDSLYPNDAKKGAVVLQRLFFDAGTLTPRFLDYCVPVLFRDQKPDQDKYDKFEEALGFLNTFMSNQQWVAGQNMTIADFSIIAVIATAEAVGFQIDKFSNINDWYQRCRTAMSSFGYEEVNQAGADTFGAMFKAKANSV